MILIYLCYYVHRLVVNVASMSIGRINRSSTAYASAVSTSTSLVMIQSLMASLVMLYLLSLFQDNLKLFQRACETLGFNESQLFDVTDLQEVPVKRGQNV